MFDLIDYAERGLLPDTLIRFGIRRLLARRLADISSDHTGQLEERFAADLRQRPLAVATDEANQQHYDVSPDFFQQVLGPRLKYSSCYFGQDGASLAFAEEQMLELTCQRAELSDGQNVLELGCGWGSLTLWMAEQHPNSRITAVSNSHSQRKYIEARASERELSNVRVITANMTDFQASEEYDRILSVEMFEHLQNYELLFQRIANWLLPQGKLFAHVFCHRCTPYLFESEGTTNWMGRNFFTGGIMPSENLFQQFRRDLTIEKQWRVNGLHYWRTCEAWLANLDRHREKLLDCFNTGSAPQESKRYLQRWRIFFMACAELFRYRQGREWFVAHYLFQKP